MPEATAAPQAPSAPEAPAAPQAPRRAEGPRSDGERPMETSAGRTLARRWTCVTTAQSSSATTTRTSNGCLRTGTCRFAMADGSAGTPSSSVRIHPGGIERRFWIGCFGAAVRAGRPTLVVGDAAARHPPERDWRLVARRPIPQGRWPVRCARRDLDHRGQLGEARLLQRAAEGGEPRRLDAGARAVAGRTRDRLRLRAGHAAHLQRRPARRRRHESQGVSGRRSQHQLGFRAAPRAVLGC